MVERVLNQSHLERPLTSHLSRQLYLAEALLIPKSDCHSEAPRIINTVKKLRQRLNRPWRFAVMGELNSGKSTAINVLLGGVRLPTQAFANTRIHTLIHYSETPQISAVLANGEHIVINAKQIGEISGIKQIHAGLPDPLLKYIEFLDCPGTSDPMQLLDDFEIYRNADAAIWCTSSQAPLRKNEIDCWREVPSHIRKRGILLVTRKDQLDEESLGKVMARLKYETRKRPFLDIITMSSTKALVATESDQDSNNDWETSGADELDRCLAELLSQMQEEKEKKIKLMIERLTRYFVKLLQG